MYSVAASRFEQLMYAVTTTTFEDTLNLIEKFTLVFDHCNFRVRITSMVTDEEVSYGAMREERNATILSQDRFALMNYPPRTCKWRVTFKWNRIITPLTIDTRKKARLASFQKTYELRITHFGRGQTLNVLTEESIDNTLRIRLVKCFVRYMIWYRRPNLSY